MDTKEGELVLHGGGLRLSPLWRSLFELQAPLMEADTSNCYGGRRRNIIKGTRRSKGAIVLEMSSWRGRGLGGVDGNARAGLAKRLRNNQGYL